MSLLDFSYLGSGIAGIAGFIAIFVAWFQLRGLKESVKHSNLMAIFEIEFELNRRKERIASIRQNILEQIKCRSREQLDDSEKNHIETLENYRKEAYEDYLNVFDRLSYFILKRKLSEEDFRLEYREMLFDTIDDDKDEMFVGKTRYRNMSELYDRWKKK